jgi:Flp pilus assembly protein TadG
MRDQTRDLRAGHSGQSLVELAVFLPILLVLFLAIADLARAYSTLIALESAAREAADWGANGGQNFDPLAAKAKWATASQSDTVNRMERRACTPMIGQPDYVGAPDGSTCTNPSFSCSLRGTDCAAPTDCDQVGVAICPVEVTLTYTFDGITPLVGSLTMVRNSTFNLADPPPSAP